MYNNIRNELNTGDIVLFSGKGAVSNIIKLFSASKWSHVGMVVKVADMDLVLVWESTTLSTVKDEIDGTFKKGVQTVSLSSRIDTYDGDIAVRKFEGTITPEMTRELTAVRKEFKDKPYEESNWELANSLLDFDILPANAEDFSSLFCSELVGEALSRMGILTGKLAANEYTPRDFGDCGRFEHYLVDGMSYGKEIQLK